MARGNGDDVRGCFREIELSLVVQSPAVQRTIRPQREGMITARGNGDKISRVTGNGRLTKMRESRSSGPSRTPANDGAVSPQRQAVMMACRDCDDVGCVGWSICLAAGIGAPSENEPIRSQRERMRAAGGDRCHVRGAGRDSGLTVGVTPPGDDCAGRTFWMAGSPTGCGTHGFRVAARAAGWRRWLIRAWRAGGVAQVTFMFAGTDHNRSARQRRSSNEHRTLTFP